MNRPSRSRIRNGAFSLVELLIVMGVMTLLLMMALQVQTLVTEQSRTARCLQQLRGIGLALSSYAMDHQRQYPPTSGFLRKEWVQAGWAEFLQAGGYLQQAKVAFCPSLDVTAYAEADHLSAEHPAVPGKSLGHFTYGLRSDHPGKVPPPFPVWTGSWTNFTWNGEVAAPIRLSLIATPASSIVVSDSLALYAGQPRNSYRYDAKTIGWSGVDFRHGRKANTLFADGHAEGLTRQQMAAFLEREDRNAPYWNGRGFSLIR